MMTTFAPCAPVTGVGINRPEALSGGGSIEVVARGADDEQTDTICGSMELTLNTGGTPMQVSVLLQRKGFDVVTVAPETSLGEVLGVLTENRIGAVVITRDGVKIDGVLSERDIVTSLAAKGSDALECQCQEVMSTEIITCEPDTTVEELMTTMTEHRVRHVPVVVDGRLSGVVSIGDVVKDRISGLEFETQALHDYITRPF